MIGSFAIAFTTTTTNLEHNPEIKNSGYDKKLIMGTAYSASDAILQTRATVIGQVIKRFVIGETIDTKPNVLIVTGSVNIIAKIEHKDMLIMVFKNFEDSFNLSIIKR